MMKGKIKIEFLKKKKGEIQQGWKVTYGKKYADGLGYDEMLGLVASITVPEQRPCLHWLRTKEEHEAMNQRFKNIYENSIDNEE